MRSLLLVLLLVDAALLGAAELFYLSVYVGAVPAPVTALLAALTMPWLVREAADLGETPIVAVSPLLVWLATISVLAFAGPGGDVLFPDGWRPLLLLAGGILPSMWALGNVRRSEVGILSSG
ncbi:MAG: hypothetical protein JWR88_1776 [Pseudonocardia sp.]|jgi:hypothetical protein|nr:hypothetical protein [Pseudonocardia sp.]